MRRIGFYYSIYSHDNLENSIRYVLQLVTNIKIFNALDVNAIDLIVHTDAFTKKIIDDICRYEDISLSKVIFRIHNRNNCSRGMFWRFESLYNTEYDINVCAEGDRSICSYFKGLEFFENSDKSLLLFCNRQISINNNCIDGGAFYVKPNDIDVNIRTKVKQMIEFIDHIEGIGYGVDENYLLIILKKHLSDLNMTIVVNNKLKIKDCIENVEKEFSDLKSIFRNAETLSIDDFQKRNFYNKYKPLDEKLKWYVKTWYGDELCYQLHSSLLKVKKPFRPTSDGFVQSNMLNILYDIL